MFVQRQEYVFEEFSKRKSGPNNNTLYLYLNFITEYTSDFWLKIENGPKNF